MPELTFTTRWPDGRSLRTYSPSLVVHDHLEVGRPYAVAEFLDRAGAALTGALGGRGVGSLLKGAGRLGKRGIGASALQQDGSPRRGSG